MGVYYLDFREDFVFFFEIIEEIIFILYLILTQITTPPGRWNNPHMEPTLISYFDVHIDGVTPLGAHFNDSMKVMLDRRPAYQGVWDFQRAHALGEMQRRTNQVEGPALWNAQLRNWFSGKARGADFDEISQMG